MMLEMRVMLIASILAGLLTIMSIFVNKSGDIRISFNDIYVIALMVGWMFLFMSIYYRNSFIFTISLIAIISSLIFIRTQFGISLNQYYNNMIPHHSMAVFLSKKVLENNCMDDEDKEFIENIIQTQEDEIKFMKERIDCR